jgi:small GTP-binding protein
MLRAILNQKQAQVLKDEKAVLERLQLALAGWDAEAADQKMLQNSIHQLDELFLLVVVGEFNSGKSAFINALLGERFFPEGVTPTTARIHVLHHGSEANPQPDTAGIVRMGHPADFLREINIVDTPGTNAIIREHEQLTREYVPRSDLVIFVTSADRPFTESERAFMERIREWGKKVIIVLNKTDQLQDADVAQVVEYIRQNALALLGFTPEIFPVSARQALQAKLAESRQEKDGLWASSRFDAVETYILRTLDEKSRLRLKLGNPLGVGEQLTGRYRGLARERLNLLAEDLAAINNIEGQLKVYQDDMQHDFRYRLADVEKILLAMNNRGMLYFDDTIRLGRVFDLINTSRIQGDFERKVIAETPQQIEQEVQGLIEWLVDRDLRQWQSTLEYLENHLAKVHDEQSKIIGKVGGSFADNRRALLESVGRAAREVMRTYDRDAEARKLAGGLRDALAGTALVEIGAVSLGVILVAVLNTAFLDFTGILAASSLAVVGLLILPAKKRRAKSRLDTRLADLRQRLLDAMTGEFDRELGRSLQRLREAIAPYTRFVRSEEQRISRVDSEMLVVEDALALIRTRVESL